MKKKLRIALYLACMAMILTMPAWAYVDPSVTTMVIQVIVGVAVVAGAVVGVVIRNIKKKAAQVLHIDENAGKVVEDDIVVTDAEAAPAEEAAPAAEETKAEE